jgi:hypothetical protein
MRGKVGHPTPDAPGLAESKATFECGDGLIEVSFAEVQKAITEACMDKAVWLIEWLGYPDLFLATDDSLGECSYLGQ